MNLLSVLSKLDEHDVINIRCWLSIRDRRLKKRTSPGHYQCYQVPADVALLNKDLLRMGATAWAESFYLPPQLTSKRNITAETARKIFGEDS